MHRDIKGANILMTEYSTCKLADFGCSFRFEDGTGTINQKKLERAGSVPWMAPEVVKEWTPGRKSDIWSFGCTVIEMLTGKRPWSGDWEKDHAPDAMSVLYQGIVYMLS